MRIRRERANCTADRETTKYSYSYNIRLVYVFAFFAISRNREFSIDNANFSDVNLIYDGEIFFPKLSKGSITRMSNMSRRDNKKLFRDKRDYTYITAKR